MLSEEKKIPGFVQAVASQLFLDFHVFFSSTFFSHILLLHSTFPLALPENWRPDKAIFKAI